MRKSVIIAASTLVLVAAFAQAVQADVVADYADDFSYPAPAPGWSYLWNANGPIGTAANYVPLWAVVAGTTVGMLLANVPVVLLGSRFASRLPLKAARIAAALVFLALGAWVALRGVG